LWKKADKDGSHTLNKEECITFIEDLKKCISEERRDNCNEDELD